MQKIVTALPCGAAAFCGETAAEPAGAILATLACMPLPIHPLPIVERWSCHQCGVCCRGSIVPLSADDVERLAVQNWHERPEFKHVATTTAYPGGGRQLAKRPDGACVFLEEDGLCRIHKELGFEAKPLICRMFPLQLIPHEKQAVLTLRRACPLHLM